MLRECAMQWFAARLRVILCVSRLRDGAMVDMRDSAIQILKISEGNFEARPSNCYR
jgi:hypothetical protein